MVQILMKKYAITSRVVLNTNEPVYPTRKDDKLIFPIGMFETVLTTREIEYAIKHNHIVEFKDTFSYEQEILFDSYVDFFFKKKVEYRLKENEAFSYMCKLFLNSLYGKFGQRVDAYKKIKPEDSMGDGTLTVFDIDKNEWVTKRSIGGLWEQSIGKVEGFDSFVSIASHITADARMKLWHYFNIAGRDNVYYTDTDSMIVNVIGYNNCKPFISDELGDLSLKATDTILKIYGAKDYVFGKDEVIKGIRKDATRLSETEFEQTRFEGIAGAIQNNRLNKMYISKVEKKLKRNYDKGIVSKDGLVSPHKLTYQPPLL